MVAMNKPKAVNDSVSPTPSATPPQRWAYTADAMTIGSSGNTHGESVDNTPESSASRRSEAATVTAQRPWSSSAPICCGVVIPVARAFSCVP